MVIDDESDGGSDACMCFGCCMVYCDDDGDHDDDDDHYHQRDGDNDDVGA